MKGMYVIATAFLASLAVNAVNSDQSVQPQGVIWPIPTVCPFPERFPHNTTTNLPHEWDCTRFYKCFLGKGVEQLCPLMIPGDPVSRLHYNRLEQVCDWPWRAGCSSCPENPRGSVLLPGPDNCRDYYECINGYPTLRHCPANTCFSRTCQACVTNRNGGNCGNSLPPQTCSNPSGNNGDKRSHDCDCAKYYMCDGYNWLQFQCSGGLHFSPTRQMCLQPNEAGCPLHWQ
ncbi:uncharacterized protein LOC105196420 isoform X3 [Solenopsis invicta]|nr:uncharacterized protein LOC105196420 isoform X3 [Solenopsis invicta]